MTSTELKSIERIAVSVFNCLEAELKSFLSSAHQRFPKECCDIASSLLYTSLHEEGFYDFKLTRGHAPEGQNHVWVENDKFVIDLTSHQFEGFDGPLILVTKNEYQLNKTPYYSITETIDIDGWGYYEELAPEFFESFYNDYYEK